MRVVIHKNGMLEMSIINVIFLTNVEKWPILINRSLLALMSDRCQSYNYDHLST